MKRLLLLVALAITALTPLSGQRLVVGDRAPELKPGKWLGETPDLGGKPAMIEFFHSLNKHSVERLEELNRIAMDTQGDLVVIVVTREHDPKVQTLLTGGGPAYYPMLDDGVQTFTAYKVKFVPYSVLHDKRGRIVWLGNPTTLSSDEIVRLIK